MFQKIALKCSGKFLSTIFIANLLLWLYFAISFMHASYAYRPDLLGDPNGTGYTYWGHSLALVESGLTYPFFRIVVCVQFPSFLVSSGFVKVFDPNFTSNKFFLGISEGGWILVGTMLLSFIQWYLVSCIFQWAWKRSPWSKKAEGHKLAPLDP